MSEEKKSIFTDFANFSRAVNSIKEETAIITRLYKLSTEGIYTNLEDIAITHTGIYTVLPEGVIKKVALYNPEAETDKEPRYHVFLCDSLKNTLNLLKAESQEKFKIARRKDQKFNLKIIEKFKNTYFQDKKLNICLFCLRRYNALIGGTTEIKAEEFKLADFLINPDYFTSSSIFNFDYDQVPGGYEKSWQSIAELAKAKYNHTCQKCGFDCRDKYFRKFLQVHYSSEEISGKRIDKITPVCIRCHAQEEGHGDISKVKEYQDFAVLLKSQGKSK